MIGYKVEAESRPGIPLQSKIARNQNNEKSKRTNDMKVSPTQSKPDLIRPRRAVARSVMVHRVVWSMETALKV